MWGRRLVKLRGHLGSPHPTPVRLGFGPASPPDSSFLLMHTLGRQRRWPQVPRSPPPMKNAWMEFSPALGRNQQLGAHSLPALLPQINKNQLKKKKKPRIYSESRADCVEGKVQGAAMLSSIRFSADPFQAELLVA